MPINPITVKYLKTFVVLGHSNAEGFGYLSNLVSNYPSYGPTTDHVTNPGESYWPNVYVLTRPQPFPLTTGNGNVPVATTADDVEWLEMTAADCDTPAAPHPHESPWNYPNIKGASWPRYLWHGWPDFDPGWASGASGIFGTGNWPVTGDSPSGSWFTDPWPTTLHGVEVPLQYYWKNYWNQQVGVIKKAIPGANLMPDDDGIFPYLYLDPWVAGSAFSPGEPYYVPSAVDMTDGRKTVLGGYELNSFYADWTPQDKFDWHPSTDRFYKQLMDEIAAGVEKLPSGTKLDIQLLVLWWSDNDGAIREQSVLEQGWERTVREVVKRLRYDVFTNEWTTLPMHQIPVVWMKAHPLYRGPNDSPGFTANTFVNEVIDRVAADDPYFTAIATADLDTMDTLNEPWFDNAIPAHAPSHFGSTGYHTAALRIMDAFEAMQVDPFDALDQDETLTVEEMKARVRGYYGKSRSQTDLADEDVLLQHMNAAMLHCLNHAGDNLWWLRRRMSLSLAAGSNSVLTLPRYVHRVLRIEAQHDVDYQLQFEQVGHAEGGKLQILLHGAGAGDYYVHFITMPKDLTADGQRIPVPKNIAEWIAVETCRRLAASSNHTSLQAHFEGESQRLLMASMRSMAQVQRSKRDRFYTQRRAVNLSYKNRNRY